MGLCGWVGLFPLGKKSILGRRGYMGRQGYLHGENLSSWRGLSRWQDYLDGKGRVDLEG